MKYDVFICHASEDKEPVVRPLLNALDAAAVKAWVDEREIGWGDGVSESIHAGLRQSRFVLLILSEAFLAKRWPAREMNAVLTSETSDGVTKLLPLMAASEDQHRRILAHYPLLADKRYLRWSPGAVGSIVEELMALLGGRPGKPSSHTPIPVTNQDSAGSRMLARLEASFDLQPGPLCGFFRDADSAADSARWQSAGGESVRSSAAVKRPYYDTYWGYEGLSRLAPHRVDELAPNTLSAISAHFGEARWLRVIRETRFADGPRPNPQWAETVRHTARAAELTLLLRPTHPRVLQVACDLLEEADSLQDREGAWKEFRGDDISASLWPSVYVFRFLSKLTAVAREHAPTIDGLPADALANVLDRTERYLDAQWRNARCAHGRVIWEEAAPAVLTEIGPYLNDARLREEAFCAQRDLLNAAGRPSAGVLARIPVSEAEFAVRLACGIYSVDRTRATDDLRFQRLLQWLQDSIRPESLRVYDLGFAALLPLDLGVPHSDLKTQ